MQKFILCVKYKVYWPWCVTVLISTHGANSFYLHFKYQLLGSILYHFNVPHPLVIRGCVFGMQSVAGLSVTKWKDLKQTLLH
jgi:hypothetical protein